MDSLRISGFIPSASSQGMVAVMSEKKKKKPVAAATAGFPSVAPPPHRFVLHHFQEQLLKQKQGNAFSTMATSRVINALQAQVNTEGVKFESGEGGLPKIVLKDATGSQAEVYTFGACVTSWKLPNGKDLLFVRPDAVFNGQKPISGGIPHCFPQFGPGAIQQHGFARNSTWSFANSENIEGSPSVVFELKDNDYTRGIWNNSFRATYKIFLQPTKLSTTLIVENTDEKPFSFTTALHTYFRASITETLVKGLKGCVTLNKDPNPNSPVQGVEDREEVDFPGFVDCIYYDAPQELFLINGLGETISISNKNWSDAVLWNPHLNSPDSYKNFVCVENGQINHPVTLQPGEKWEAEQVLSIC